MIDFQNILLLIIAVSNFVLAIFIYSRNRKSGINQSFAAFIFFISPWALSLFLYRQSESTELALYFMKWAYASVLLSAASYWYFSYVFPENIPPLKGVEIIFSIPTILLFGAIVLIPNFLTKGIIIHSYGKETLLGTWEYSLFAGYFLYAFIGGLIRGWRKLHALVGIAKLQMLYVLTSVAIAGFFGMFFNLLLPSPMFHNFQWAWLGPLFTSIIVVGIVYAILRYRLMDIHLIWKNLIVYSGMLVYTFFMYHAGTGLVMRVIGSLYSNSAMMMEIPLIIFYVISMIKISEELTEVSEKRLFGSFFLYQQKLRELTQDLTTVIDFDALTQKIVKGIMDIMRVERAGLLLKENGGRDHYKIQHVVGFYEENGISLAKDNFLTEYLGKTQKAIVYEELQFIIRDTFDEEKKTRLKKLLDNMKSIEAELCVPLFSKNVLEGIIVLGPKQTGEAYNQGELDLLETLASQASIAIENAKLYEKVQDLNENLEAKVKEQTKTLEDQNARLKGLLELKSEFLHIVSHQLRTPLTTLRGFLQFWKSGEFKQFPEDQQKDMQERIYNSSERLNTLINDMLTAMDLEGGAFHFTFGTVDVKEIIRAIYEELKDYFAEKQLEFRFAPPEDDRKIMGDSRYLREALSNIIDNAQKYTPSGFVEATIENGENTVIIKIHDSGMGISERDKTRIFNKFIRGERAEELIPNGTGLGLYIAKQIIEGHKGTVTMDSPGEGQGATATITLPIIQ